MSKNVRTLLILLSIVVVLFFGVVLNYWLAAQ